MQHQEYANRTKGPTGAVGAPMLPEFKPPDGLDLNGDSGSAQIRWRKKPNGSICITSVNGVSLPGAEVYDSGDDEGSLDMGDEGEGEEMA